MVGENISLDEIGATLGITRQRVQQIIDTPPRKPGPPFRPETIEALRSKLALWKRRLEARLAKGQSIDVAELRIAAINAEIDFIANQLKPIEPTE